MNRITIFFLIAVAMAFGACKTDGSYLMFEKHVMKQIFPSLIETVCVDSRIFLHPPPQHEKIMQYPFDKKEGYRMAGSKLTEAQKNEWKVWEEEIKKIKKDTAPVIIAFDPLLAPSAENLAKELEEHYRGARPIILNKKDSYVFDYQTIKLKGPFKVRNLSGFPASNKIWDTPYDFVFSGIVFFSRIQFDQGRNFGVLEASFTCGGKCGKGYHIFIKKVNGAWEIDTVADTWIS